MAGRSRLACFGAREKGTCDNHLTIRRDEVEERVLKALEQKLLNQELFEEFCEEFTREMNRLRGEHRANLMAGERELARLEARRKKLVESIIEGLTSGLRAHYAVEPVNRAGHARCACLAQATRQQRTSR